MLSIFGFSMILMGSWETILTSEPPPTPVNIADTDYQANSALK